MSRLLEASARATSIDELAGIVTAMRSLAAARLQRAESALPGIRRYAEIMAEAVARARSLLAAPREAPASREELAPCLVVITAEHGFVGAFNERLIDRAAVEPEASSGRLAIVGSRGVALARARGLAVEWHLPMVPHAAGVFEAARRLAAEVEARLARGEIDRLAVLWARRGPNGAELARLQLLPLELAPAAAPRPRSPPLHHLAPLALLAQVAGEHVAGELVRVLMESLACENAARLTAMDAARQHIDDKLRALRAELQALRQEEITDELLDVITGAEAMRPRAGR